LRRELMEKRLLLPDEPARGIFSVVFLARVSALCRGQELALSNYRASIRYNRFSTKQHSISVLIIQLGSIRHWLRGVAL
jgi:hypothetical protein